MENPDNQRKISRDSSTSGSTKNRVRQMIVQILHQELRSSFRSYSRSFSRTSRSHCRSSSFHHVSSPRHRSRSPVSRSRSPSVSRRRKRRDSQPYQSSGRSLSSRARSLRRHSNSNDRSPRGAEFEDPTGTHSAVVAPTNTIGDVLVLSEDVGEELSADTLNILGVDPEKSKTPGFTLHQALVVGCSHVLSNGLPSNEISTLVGKHTAPSNCTLLLPPKINPEVKVILSPAHVTRDSSHSEYQLSIGNGLSALGKAFSTILEEENSLPKDIREKILSNLTDSARIFTNLFYKISKTRKYLISPVLNKSVKGLTDNTVPDEFLFGPDLGERTKTLKFLEKAGQDLLSASTPFRNSASTSSQAEKRGGEYSSKIKGLLNRYRPSYHRREVRHYKSQNLPKQSKRPQYKKR